MARYPEAEGRERIGEAHCVVVDLESYRRRRTHTRHDADAGREPGDEGEDVAGAGSAPAEGNHKD